jgi:uncharacterized membrane protein SirB2
MEEFYLQIRSVHIGAVLASGGLFLLRGLGVNAFIAAWPMWAPVRYLSYTIDTVLLTAALMLMTIVHQYPFMHAWLTVKVVLLAAYIVLGSFALKRGATRKARLAYYVAALLVFGFIYTVARAHNPLGIFASALPHSHPAIAPTRWRTFGDGRLGRLPIGRNQSFGTNLLVITFDDTTANDATPRVIMALTRGSKKEPSSGYICQQTFEVV